MLKQAFIYSIMHMFCFPAARLNQGWKPEAIPIEIAKTNPAAEARKETFQYLTEIRNRRVLEFFI